MSGQPQEGIVIIGRKPLLNYVTACLSLFNSGAPQVKIKARGQAICHAIDVVELLRKAFIKDLETQNISIGTQEFRFGGRDTRVSTIEMTLLKPKKK